MLEIERLHPEWDRSCSSCREWQYDDNGDIKQRNGKPVKRLAMSSPPCHKCPKIPKSIPKEDRNWENAVEKTADLEQILAFCERCDAVGRWPDEDIVAELAVVWRQVMREAEARSYRQEIERIACNLRS